MIQNFEEISNTLSRVKWTKRNRTATVIGFPQDIPKNWPFYPQLEKMMSITDKGHPTEGPIGEHVKRVIAYINAIIDDKFDAKQFLRLSNQNQLDRKVAALLSNAHLAFWTEVQSQRPFIEGLLRICALYHDIGKLISVERHVSRGLHLMRDVRDEQRQEIESLFDDFPTRREFWAILRHHDIFGCLCTGEASLPAISAMISWSYPNDMTKGIDSRISTHLACLLWLNIADVSARLHKKFGKLTVYEAERYITDWMEIQSFLEEGKGGPRRATRERFNGWLFETASHVDRTIERITRLVTTCYHVETARTPPVNVKALVEEELQALHGPRLERFCHNFACFTKADYGLRFFSCLMKSILLHNGVLKRVDGKEMWEVPEDKNLRVVQPRLGRNQDRILQAMRSMVSDTCLILSRIVEEYEHLVDSSQHASRRLGIDMSGLMRPPETGWAICQALEDRYSRALWWITDEVSVWLYPE